MKFRFLLLSSLLSTAIYAEESAPSSKLIESIVPAKPVKRVGPVYPIGAQRNGHEGWVRLSFVIEPDGSVSNTFVTDSSGRKAFEHSALKAVEQWQFTPATDKDGNAIQQCVHSIQMDYTMENNNKSAGATRRFRGKYKTIVGAFDAKDFEKARQLLDVMGESKKFNMYEDQLYWQLKGYYYQYIGDDKNALANFNRSSYRLDGISDQSYLTILDNIFTLQLKQNLLADALSTYAKIEATQNNEQTLTRLKPYQQRINTLIEGNNAFSVPATIGERGFVHYKLARSQFELSNIQGQVDTLKVFCDNKQNTFSYAADSAWTIPASWGRCSLYVHGNKETTFNIIELPKNI
jgi:TonB family protein